MEGVASVDSTSVEGTFNKTDDSEETRNGEVVESSTYSESIDLVEDEFYAGYFASEEIGLENSGEAQYKMVIADDPDYGGTLELNCSLTSDTSMTCDLEKSSLIDDLDAGDEGVTREYSGSLVFEK